MANLAITTVKRTSISKIQTVCDSLMSSQCNPPNTSNGKGYEIHIYEDTIDFGKAPYKKFYDSSTVSRITFYGGQCCRSGAITTGPHGSDFYVKSELYTKINGKRIYNSSPKILLERTNASIAFCNTPYSLGAPAYDDIEYDSFGFELAPGLAGLPNTSVNYSTPFTFNNPMTPFCIPPTTITCTPNTSTIPPRGFSFSPIDGNIIFTPTICNQVGVIVRKLMEFRKIGGNHVLIGTVFIEQQISVIDDGYNNFEVPNIGGPTRIQLGSTIAWSIRSKDVKHSLQIAPDTTDIEIISAPNGTVFIRDTAAAYKREVHGTLKFTPNKSQVGQYHTIILKYYETNRCPNFSQATLTKKIFVYSGENVVKLRPFNDKNGNGTKDVGEPYIKGVQFYYGNGLQENVTTSNDTGLARYISKNPAQMKFKLGYSDIYSYTVTPSTPSFSYDDTTYNILVPLKVKGHVTGRVFYDQNQNCDYSGTSENIGRFTTVGLGTNYGVANHDGTFLILIDSSKTVGIALDPGFDTTVCNSYAKLQPKAYDKDSIYDLGNIPLKGVEDISLDFSTTRIRRGNNFTLTVETKNMDGPALNTWYNKPLRVWVKLPSKVTYKNATNLLTFDSSMGAYYYDIANIASYASIFNFITLYTDTAGTSTGQKLKIMVKFDTLFSDYNVSNNSYIQYPVITGPYDPNEKLVLGTSSVFRKNKISYRINYQNLGSDTAFNVVIRDDMNVAFDMRTLEFKRSSSPAEITIKGREITFALIDHKLPPKVLDEEGSCGFVEFDIMLNQKSDAAYSVDNYAAIYFDYEAPVYTANVNVKHVPFSEILNMDKTVYCQNETLNIKYLARAMNTDTRLRLELSANNGATWTPTTLSWKHNVFNDTGSVSFTLPFNFPGATTYKLRIMPLGFATNFVNSSSTFTIDPLVSVFTKLKDSICQGEALVINLKNATTYDLYKNNSLYKTNLSSGNQTYPNTDFVSGDSLKVVATKTNGCVYSNRVEVKINNTKVTATLDMAKYCDGQGIKLIVDNKYPKFDLQKNSTNLYSSVNYGTFNMGNAATGSLELKVIGFTPTNALCRDTLIINPKLYPIYPLKANLTKSLICKGEQIELELDGPAKFTITADNVKVKQNLSTGKYIIDNPQSSLSVSTLDSFNCATTIPLTPATVEALPLPIVNIDAPDPLCEKDEVKLTLTNADTASYIVNNKYVSRLNKNVPYAQYMLGEYNLRVNNEYISALGCIYKAKEQRIDFGPYVKPKIFRKGDTLYTSVFKQYQWYNENGNITSSKDTMQEFIPAKNGVYYVTTINFYNCDATSDNTNYISNNISSILSKQGIQLMPNPFGSQIKISNHNKVNAIVIYTITGKLVRSSDVNDGIINTEDLKPGQYIFEIHTKAGTESVIMTKN